MMSCIITTRVKKVTVIRAYCYATYVNALKYANYCVNLRIAYACEALRMYAYDNVCA